MIWLWFFKIIWKSFILSWIKFHNCAMCSIYSIDFNLGLVISGWLGFWLDGDIGADTERRRIWKLWQSSVQQKITAPDCDTICDNEHDEELTEDVWWVCAGSTECLFRFLCRWCCCFLATRSNLITTGGDYYNKMSTTSRFQVCVRWLWFGPTFIIPINFMSNPLDTLEWNKKYFLLSQGFSSVSLFIFSTNVFLYFGAKDTWPWIRNWEKKANPHSLIWFV